MVEGAVWKNFKHSVCKGAVSAGEFTFSHIYLQYHDFHIDHYHQGDFISSIIILINYIYIHIQICMFFVKELLYRYKF